MTILFIGTGFYQYDTYIVNELNRISENVKYINSREYEKKHPLLFSISSRTTLMKSFEKKASDYLMNQIVLVNNEMSYDVIFVIRGEYLSEESLTYLRQHNPEAKFVLYLWDAWQNHNNKDILKHFFDTIYSFDYLDCQKHGFNLRPLFYIETFNHSFCSKRDINICFVGGHHSDRLHLLTKLKELCRQNQRQYVFRLLVGRFDYFKYILLRNKKEIKDIITCSFIRYNQYLNLLDHSIAVIDIPNEYQSGLTIRTIEALSRGTKVVTTSKFVKYYNNIPNSLVMVINPESFDEKKLIDFISSPSNEVIGDYFSLRSFINEIFN